MKVLFAVNNEKISEAIINKYQANYKEIISVKNVYYFNAIVKELQRDKSYDRVIISEDLEPYSNRNYDMIDKFLFEKLDDISDEASNKKEGEIPIILICTERRNKGDQMLVKLFSIGIYDALLGKDRTVENLCKLINTPRNKRDAKVYYKIDTDDAEYKSENANDVNESEIQNIINHYKKLGKNEDRYIESFNNIATQYTDEQLKIISGFLPLGVRAVLEEKCPKYQELMMTSVKGRVKKPGSVVTKNIKATKNINKIDVINKSLENSKIKDNVIIPSNIDVNNVKKIYNTPIVKKQETYTEIVPNDNIRKMSETENDIKDSQNDNIDTDNNNDFSEVKRGRGRPAKKDNIQEKVVTPVKRGRGRPKKETLSNNDSVQLPGLDENEEDNNVTQLPGLNENDDDDNNATQLPGLDENEEDNNVEQQLPGLDEDRNNDDNNATQLPGLDTNNSSNQVQGFNHNINNSINQMNNNMNMQKNINWNNSTNNINNIQTNNSWENNNNETGKIISTNSISENLTNLLTSDKKIVAFVGTSKNGTSFLVNNLATMLSASMGINTAILDLTKNKNAYYIYTQNDEEIRSQAINSVENLRMGSAKGVTVNKNLSVYTTLPNEDEALNDCDTILQTLVKNYSLVLMDCDFNTNYNYFSQAQEIYLVQTYDILTIQPLTAFLRELEDRNLINPSKLRVVINKALKVKNLTEKMIIGGISRYNSPDMTYQKELFDINTILYTTIPFEDQTYAKYLEGLVTCEISLNGYSKGLLDSLSSLCNMVYPLISSNQSSGKVKNYNDYNSNNNYKNKNINNDQNQFNKNINDTLNRMRNKF